MHASYKNLLKVISILQIFSKSHNSIVFFFFWLFDIVGYILHFLNFFIFKCIPSKL